MLKMTALQIDDEDWKRLKKLAWSKGLTAGGVVRELISNYVNSTDDPTTPEEFEKTLQAEK